MCHDKLVGTETRSAGMDLHSFFSMGDGQVSISLTTTSAVAPQAASTKKFGEDGSVVRNRYTVMKTLGEGAQGKVKLAQDALTGREVAMKFCPLTNSKTQKMVREEVNFLQRAQGHKNVLGFVESFSCENYFITVLNREACDLFDIIDELEHLPLDQAKRVLKQLLSGLSHLHKRGIAHRDIKPENLLMDNRNAAVGNVKICDFGLAASFGNACNSQLSTVCGSDAYAAPEVLDEKGYEGPMVDVWSTGIVMYNIITSFSPWGSATLSDEVFYKFITAPRDFWAWTRKWSPVEISAEFEDLFSRLCNPDPKKRPTAAQACEHPFFAGVSC